MSVRAAANQNQSKSLATEILIIMNEKYVKANAQNSKAVIDWLAGAARGGE